MSKKPKIRCLISAGPTREWIDPVRFISNPSSGKMGYALAEAAKDLKMEVSLISGPVNLPNPKGVHLVRVETAIEMQEAMESQFEGTDLIIMCAAVSDHRPSVKYEKKLRKDEFPNRIIFKRNPDILKILGRKKKKNQVLVGFAAETNDILNSAQNKLKEKNLDWIVANDVSKNDIGFSSDKNEVTLISVDGFQMQIPSNNKSKIAKEILDAIYPSCLEKVR
ncbi:MAG: bifunctional phosphopantothenoylcysteine decarboxylase/phosphopantothenate--cysteine ligase CoaBC [Opitutae bacterium]